MNFLLKIVQGPNAGAEVALVEGLCVKLGRADTCDLVLADPTLPEVACEIDTSADRVMLFLPGGTQERLEPLRVRSFGATALAIGPADAPWGELTWPAPVEPGRPTPEADATPTPVNAPQAPTHAKRPRRAAPLLRWAAALLLLALLLALCYHFRAAIIPHAKASLAWAHETWQQREAARKPPAPVRLDIAEPVARYHLQMERQANAPTRVWGNFATRAERLHATAELYTAEPGALLQLSDDESLRTAADETLFMLTEGRVTVAQALNRTLSLAGAIESTAAMQTLLEALKQDIPYLAHIDCAQVICGKRTPGDGAETALREKAATRNPSLQSLPFCGILTTPYPCIVLRDGSRVMEGAEFGGFVVDRIEPDRIVIHNASGAFDWRP